MADSVVVVVFFSIRLINLDLCRYPTALSWPHMYMYNELPHV